MPDLAFAVIGLLVTRHKVRHDDASEQLVRVSVQHALDAREIRQQHVGHQCPAPTSCAQAFRVADTISRASLWLARRLYPIEQPAR